MSIPRFIERRSSLKLGVSEQLKSNLIKYSIDGYEPKLFEFYNILFPKSIANSVKKRQAEYLAGRLCVESCLRRIGYQRFNLLSHPERFPIWPENVVGSISHNAEYAVSCISDSRHTHSLGLDIERVFAQTDDEIYSISKYTLTPPELDYVKSLANMPFNRVLTLVFSAKESIYKALYPKLRKNFNFDALEVTKIDPKKGAMTFKARQSLGGGVWIGEVFRVDFLWIDQKNVLTYHCKREGDQFEG